VQSLDCGKVEEVEEDHLSVIGPRDGGVGVGGGPRRRGRGGRGAPSGTRGNCCDGL